MGNRTRVVGGLTRQLEDARRQVDVLQKEKAKLLGDLEELAQERINGMRATLALDTMKEREEGKHLEILFLRDMASVNSKTVETLSQRVRDILEAILRRGKIRAKYSPEYRAVRDAVFANHKVDQDMLVNLCKRNPSLDAKMVLGIMEELLEKEFTESEREDLLRKALRA